MLLKYGRQSSQDGRSTESDADHRRARDDPGRILLYNRGTDR